MCLQPSDVDKLTNEEILELDGPKLDPDAGVIKLTPSTVAKASQDSDEDAADASEANALDLLFMETTIPVPRVRRVVKHEWGSLIVMDCIPGSTLAHVWPTFDVAEHPCGFYIARLCSSAPSPESVCRNAAWPTERARSKDL